MVAPVLPITVYAVCVFLLLGYLRFSPTGIFNPANEPDRDFPSLYHPKSVARRRAAQRQRQLQRFQQQQQQQQCQRLLGEAGPEELAKSGGSEGSSSGPVVRLAVEEGKVGENGGTGGITVGRA